jgi:hypothetical protein
MLCPGCFVEEEFTRRNHLTMVRVQKDLPYLFPDRRSSGFSGYLTRDVLSSEIFFKALNLSGLAAPFHAFKSNKEGQRSLQ